MAGESLSVDDLLARQQEEPTLLEATVEAVADRPDDVQVTPFLRDAGCQCAFAIVVPKNAIESLTTTDTTHLCCGKRLVVVPVAFADPVVAGVFAQLADRARLAPGPPPAQEPMPVSNRSPFGEQVVLSTEEAALGIHAGSTTSGVPSDPCAAQRTKCLLRCGWYHPGELRCECHCHYDYYRCIGQRPPFTCNHV